MKIHVSSILAKGVIKINKQTQQTSSHNGLEKNNQPPLLEQIRKITISHHCLEHEWPHKLKKEYSMPSMRNENSGPKTPDGQATAPTHPVSI